MKNIFGMLECCRTLVLVFRRDGAIYVPTFALILKSCINFDPSMFAVFDLFTYYSVKFSVMKKTERQRTMSVINI